MFNLIGLLPSTPLCLEYIRLGRRELKLSLGDMFSWKRKTLDQFSGKYSYIKCGEGISARRYLGSNFDLQISYIPNWIFGRMERCLRLFYSAGAIGKSAVKGTLFAQDEK